MVERDSTHTLDTRSDTELSDVAAFDEASNICWALDSGTIYVGVTGDELLVSKQHRDLIQPYETRAAAARTFLQAGAVQVITRVESA